MPNIDSVSTSLRDLWTRATASSGPAPAAPTTVAKPGTTTADAAVAYGDALDRMPTPSLALATVVTRMDPVGAKLDQLKAAVSGPYTVNGTTVYSGAQFRMSQGYNENTSSEKGVQAALSKAAAQAGVTAELPLLKVGRGSPEALVKLTQALINDGQLPAGSTRTLSEQIHDLQWHCGIGMDCAGYVYRAVAAVNGDPAKLGLKAPDYESFVGLPSNPHFQQLTDLKTVRPGDVVVLAGSGAPHDPGHNLVVRSHATATNGAALARWPDAKSFIGQKDVELYEVDSSFGADASGRPDGGVRRDVLLYDKDLDRWCTIKSTTPAEVLDTKTPYGERALTGFFRPKSVR